MSGRYVIMASMGFSADFVLRRRAKGTPKIITLACESDRIKETISQADIIGVNDDDWLHENYLRWNTRLRDSWDEVIDEIINLSKQGRVLLVTNTVRQAVGLYRKLRKISDNSNIILIHGRLTDEERKEQEDKITNLKTGIIVATQVIEAGVDINAIAVYTEAAPIENLTQRSGRACRRGEVLKYCRDNGAIFTIITDTSSYTHVYDKKQVIETINYIKHIIGTGRMINWRTPCRMKDNEVPYTVLIENIDKKIMTSRYNFNIILLNIYEKYLLSDGLPKGIRNLLRDVNICSIFRNTMMIPVETPYGQVAVSLRWILNNQNKILETGENKAPIIVVKTIDNQSQEAKETARGEAIQLVKVWRRANDCTKLYTALAKDIENIVKELSSKGRITWAFLAKKEAYIPGEGLLLPEVSS